jgi:glutamate racemase
MSAREGNPIGVFDSGVGGLSVVRALMARLPFEDIIYFGDTARVPYVFVPLVEEGWLDHPVTRLTAEEYLKPLLAHDLDTLLLGCTHYPLLKPLLQEVVGDRITLVDSAQAMADQTAAMLERKDLGNPQEDFPHYRFYVTDVPYRFQSIGQAFLGCELDDVQVVKW